MKVFEVEIYRQGEKKPFKRVRIVAENREEALAEAMEKVERVRRLSGRSSAFRRRSLRYKVRLVEGESRSWIIGWILLALLILLVTIIFSQHA